MERGDATLLSYTLKYINSENMDPLNKRNNLKSFLMRMGRTNFLFLLFIRISVVLDKASFEHQPCAFSVHPGVHPGYPCCPLTVLVHIRFLFSLAEVDRLCQV